MFIISSKAGRRKLVETNTRSRMRTHKTKRIAIFSCEIIFALVSLRFFKNISGNFRLYKNKKEIKSAVITIIL